MSINECVYVCVSVCVLFSVQSWLIIIIIIRLLCKNSKTFTDQHQNSDAVYWTGEGPSVI